ncbi:MAG: NADH-quinone oxidoreductase subunit M [Candidatus Coatesbacteria bacterium]
MVTTVCAWGTVAAALAGLGWFVGLQLAGDTVYWISNLMAVTATASVIVMAIPDRYERFIKWISAVFAFAALVLSICLALQFQRGEGVSTFQFAESSAWIPGLGASYLLAVDGIGVAMELLTGIIIFCGVLASWRVEHRPREFFALLLLLVTGVFGVFAAQDLFVFFLFYEVAVLPMYLLIGIWGTGPKEYSAMKLTLYLLMGSALMLVGFLALYFGTETYGAPGAHTLTFSLDAMRRTAYPIGVQKFYFPFLFIGFGILSGFWPLHTWSPDGHASAPTAVSMLHAGVLMKLGAFGIIRIGVELCPEGARFWLPYFSVFTLVNITYGAFSAMSQVDLKYVIAYSSVSHMGIVILGICTLNDAGLNGAVLQMFSHGIMTGMFFALVGFTYEKTHTRMIAEYGGLGAKMPVIATFFTIAGLASLGLPGLSGFVAEFMVFLGAWQMNRVMCAIAAVGIVVTAAYVLRVLQKCFWGPLTNPHYDEITDASPVQILCLTILASVLVAVGMLPGWLVSIINSGVGPVLARVAGGG